MKIRPILLGTLIVFHGLQAEKLRLTQMDELLPTGIRYLDTLNTVSTKVELPGFQPAVAENKVTTGYINSEGTIKNQTPITPYASFEHPIGQSAAGIYVGNLQTEFSERNALDPNDSTRQGQRNFFSMNGGSWCTPATGYLKGVSLFFDGVADYTYEHIADVDAWKRLHTDISKKNQSVTGILSGAFSFFGNDYWLVRARFGRGRDDSNRALNDTLYFTDDYFIISSSETDVSCTRSLYGAEIGYIFRNEPKKYSMGCVIGQNQFSGDFGEHLNDSATSRVSLFVQKVRTFKKLSVYTGATIQYTGTFYLQQDSFKGFTSLVRSYTLNQSQHRIDCSIPLFLDYRPIQQLAVFWGAEVSYRYATSNYSPEINDENFSRDSGLHFDLRPLGIRYSPTSRMAISVAPAISRNVFLSSVDVSLTF